jgi:AbrB family looped-hinge helix DNA binding protein
METVKLSAKGQIVIPKQIRESMHWQAGTTFNVVVTGSSLMLMPVPLFEPTTHEQAAGCLHRVGRTKLDESETDATIRRMAKERDEATRTKSAA